jgi:pimeloyl-ACP methyl ester carboxylesterase
LREEKAMIFDAITSLTFSTIGKLLGMALAILIVAILAISIIDKLFKYFGYRYSPLRVQRGELIKKKMFKCSDVYELKWNGEINEKGTHILLYIHDFVGDRNDANKMMGWFAKKDDKYSVVSYDQRWCGANVVDRDRNYGANLSDLKEIIYDLHDRFKNQKLILVGHGFGAALAMACAHEEGVATVVAGSLKIKEGYKKPFATRSRIFWSWIFSAKSVIEYPYDAPDLTDDVAFVKELQKKQGAQDAYSVREYYQTRHLYKYGIKKYNHNHSENLIVLQPDKSIYASPDKFAKIAANINGAKIEPVKQCKHHLFNTTSSEVTFEKIYNLIKN